MWIMGMSIGTPKNKLFKIKIKVQAEKNKPKLFLESILSMSDYDSDEEIVAKKKSKKFPFQMD